MSKVIRLLPVLLTAAVLCVLAGCFDPEPAEVSMNITYQGSPRPCTIQVFNSTGKQIQEVSSDQFGVAYVKSLMPGQYTFKFKGHDGQYYPAERQAEVAAGGNAFLKVELTEAVDPAAAAPAS